MTGADLSTGNPDDMDEKTGVKKGHGGLLAFRRLLPWAALGVLALACAVWGAGKWSYARRHVSTDNAQVDGHIVPVLAKVGGYVLDVAVEENQRVRQGAPVVRLDPAELEVRLAEAEADVAAARAALGADGRPGQVQAEATATRARREALEARLGAARMQRDRAERDLGRATELAGKEIASPQQLDAAQAGFDQAVADVAALEREVAAAGAAEAAVEASERMARARVARAEAAAAQARLNLGYAEIRAPVEGVVSRATVEVGQLVQPGQPLAALVADSSVWVTVNLKETELARVRKGLPVEIEVDAYPGCAVEGEVESLSPATGSKFALIPPDNATGNFTKVVQRIPVRVTVKKGCGPNRPLRPGMSVVAHIRVG